MQATDLKFPGGYTHAKTIRREVAHTISQLEDAAVYGTPDPAFSEFLQDAASKTPGYVAAPLPATQVIVSNGGTINVENSAGNLDSAATATVAGGVLTGAKLAATKTIVTASDAVTVRNSTGSKSVAATAAVAAGVVSTVDITSTTATVLLHGDTVPVKDAAGVVRVPGATAEVVAGVVVSARLAANASVAVIPTATKFPVGAVTGSGTFGTFTVANGVITGIVLSAS